MKKPLAGILFVAFALAISSIALAASGLPPAGYNGPVAERPTYIKGEWWHYQMKNGQKVKWVFDHQEDSSRGKLNVFHSGTNKSLLYVTLGLGIARKVDVATGKVLYDAYEAHPGQTMEEIEFPVWIGKSWKYVQPVIDQEAGGYVQAYIEYSVVSYGILNVKGGAYEAFEIVRKHQVLQGADVGSGEETFWYAPSIKNFVKYDLYQDSRELIAKKVAE